MRVAPGELRQVNMARVQTLYGTDSAYRFISVRDFTGHVVLIAVASSQIKITPRPNYFLTF